MFEKINTCETGRKAFFNKTTCAEDLHDKVMHAFSEQDALREVFLKSVLYIKRRETFKKSGNESFESSRFTWVG